VQPLLFNFGVCDVLFGNIATRLKAESGSVLLRSFPDGESYLRISSDCKRRDIIIACSLDRPNAKTLQLLLASGTLRDLGARRIGLIAPYLAYMRQDKAFQPGEGVSVQHYARLLSHHFDWLTTVDPHLHRLAALDEVYSVPTRVTHAAPLLAEWILQHVEKPVLIGPDSESKQWVSRVADQSNSSYLLLDKIRSGDRAVRVSVPDIERFPDHTPVLDDDIIFNGPDAGRRHRAPCRARRASARLHGSTRGIRRWRAGGAARGRCRGCRYVEHHRAPHQQS